MIISLARCLEVGERQQPLECLFNLEVQQVLRGGRRNKERRCCFSVHAPQNMSNLLAWEWGGLYARSLLTPLSSKSRQSTLAFDAERQASTYAASTSAKPSARNAA